MKRQKGLAVSPPKFKKTMVTAMYKNPYQDPHCLIDRAQVCNCVLIVLEIMVVNHVRGCQGLALNVEGWVILYVIAISHRRGKEFSGVHEDSGF